MTRFVRANWLILGLAALAVVQVGILGLQRGAGENPALSSLQVGDTLSGVSAIDSRGRKASFPLGDPVVLLVFHSECGHCENVAPLWKAWTEAPRLGARAVAISSEPSEVAKAYAEQHEWDVEVWTVEDGRLGSMARALTSRTPWVFVLDDGGVILAEGHGSRVAELGAASGIELKGSPGL